MFQERKKKNYIKTEFLAMCINNAQFQVTESLTNSGLNMQGATLSHLKLLQIDDY